MGEGGLSPWRFTIHKGLEDEHISIVQTLNLIAMHAETLRGGRGGIKCQMLMSYEVVNFYSKTLDEPP